MFDEDDNVEDLESKKKEAQIFIKKQIEDLFQQKGLPSPFKLQP